MKDGRRDADRTRQAGRLSHWREKGRSQLMKRTALVCAIAFLVLMFAGANRSLEGASLKEIHDSSLQPQQWSSDKITIANLGHATLLANFFGTRLITDPVFSNRVGVSIDGLLTIGPGRHVPSPLTIEGLPQLDLILITHAHMDHLDLPSLSRLRKSAVVVACQGCTDLIKPLGFSEVRELGWGQTTQLGGLSVTAAPARHWGRRFPWGPDRGYNSYVLEKNGVRMLIACDSAFTDVFAKLRNDPPTIAAFSIGAYDPWISNHANPEQVWQMFKQTRARYLIPIHWGTFKLSREPMDEPLSRLVAAAGSDSDRIVMREIGAAWEMPASLKTAMTR
jgi:L-ascorbate metabolism protein UlaG (beta-lactamase superfamily)